jgi:bleomycin hydrolase
MVRPRKTATSREALPAEWLQHAVEQACTRLDRDGADLRSLRRRGFEAAAIDREVIARHNRRYSLELPFGSIRNQEQSGRCWLFAPVTLATTAALRSGCINSDDAFSENYLYFFNLLEQARATLFDVRHITTRKDSLGRDTLRRTLTSEVMGLGDGGEWEWAFALIKKYGLVPARTMPETASSRNTRALTVDLHECLARAAREMRTNGGSREHFVEHALSEIIRILVAHLGRPPLHVPVRRRTLSPSEYASDVVGFKPDEWRVAISNPLLAFGRVYERRASALLDDSPRFNLRRLNVSQRRLREMVRDSLAAGYAVGCSADVDRNDIDHRRGIMHPSIFNRARVYGRQLVRDLPRREDIYLGIASSKHAMAIAGLDTAAPRSAPIKYKVVNSWGPGLGDRGIYHMYAEWFEENVFKLAIHASILNARERAAYRDPEPVPGGSFY